MINQVAENWQTGLATLFATNRARDQNEPDGEDDQIKTKKETR
jgi:hypothetical protein